MLDSVRDINPFRQRSSALITAGNLPRRVLCWDVPQNFRRWLAWWYLAIAAGFAALAIDHLLLRDVLWLVGIRLILAAGFGLLSWMEFRTSRRRKD